MPNPYVIFLQNINLVKLQPRNAPSHMVSVCAVEKIVENTRCWGVD